MTAPALRLQGVSKHYGTVRAVDRVTLEVRPGEVYALLGLNGAGKTTVMRTVLGMVRPSAAGAATRTARGPRPCSATPAPRTARTPWPPPSSTAACPPPASRWSARTSRPTSCAWWARSTGRSAPVTGEPAAALGAEALKLRRSRVPWATAGAVALTVLVAQVLAAVGHGAWYPWAVPALLAGTAGPDAAGAGPGGVLGVALVALGSAAATAARWERADHSAQPGRGRRGRRASHRARGVRAAVLVWGEQATFKSVL